VYEIVYAPFAEQLIDAALMWWGKNRPAASGLLAREMDEAMAWTSTRRLLLTRSGYHPYYAINEPQKRVEIAYFRHARWRPLRGR